MKALIASSNLNKAKELRAVSRDFGVELLLPHELNLSSKSPEVIEDGKNYFENALIKARAYQQWAKMPVIADDSGLEVEILENRPGIFSARYGGEVSQDSKNQMIIDEILLAEKKLGIKNRNAAFCCSLVLYFSEQSYFHETGKTSGQILELPRGKGGFGYDPIVLIDSIGKTLAEIDFNMTTQVGFRSIAARKLFNGLDSSAWLVS